LMAGGFLGATLPGALPLEAFARATIRALVIFAVYRLLRSFFERPKTAEAITMSPRS